MPLNLPVMGSRGKQLCQDFTSSRAKAAQVSLPKPAGMRMAATAAQADRKAEVPTQVPRVPHGAGVPDQVPVPALHPCFDQPALSVHREGPVPRQPGRAAAVGSNQTSALCRTTLGMGLPPSDQMAEDFFQGRYRHQNIGAFRPGGGAKG